jgi:hypothetical protein
VEFRLITDRYGYEIRLERQREESIGGHAVRDAANLAGNDGYGARKSAQRFLEV